MNKENYNTIKNYSNFGLRHIYLLTGKKKKKTSKFNKKKTCHDEHLFVP